MPALALPSRMALPESLLTDIHWSFSEPPPVTPLDLLEEARQYAADIGAPDVTSMLGRALPVADLVVHCRYDVRNAQGVWVESSRQHRVVSASGPLTGADLLWEIHIAFADAVGRGDKHYFEGLELMSIDGVPVYELVLGS